MRWLLTALLALAVQSVAAQAAAGLAVLHPKEAKSSTAREFVNVLARTTAGTAAGTTARVDGVVVPVYATGVFVRDRVPLQPGPNLLTIEVTTAQGEVLRQQIEVERVAPPPAAEPPTDRLWIDTASIQPQQLRQLSDDEALEVSFRGTAGMKAQMRHGSGPWQGLVEAEPGRYAGRLLLRAPAGSDDDLPAQPLQLRLVALRGQISEGPHEINASTPGAVGLWRRTTQRLFVTGPEGAALTHGLHEVRLGGPFLTELPAGVLLRANGQQGEQLRVELAPQTSAWVPLRVVQPAAAGVALPQPVFTSVQASATAGADVVTIPFPATLPHAARLVAAHGRQHLEVDLFGTHEAATWITHAAALRVVREVSVQQVASGHVRVRIDLAAPRLWGWRIETDRRALRIFLRHPPALGTAPASPLQGLTIALEAGHGSSANLGAVGATGVPEKDINRWTTDVLKAELEALGAKVVDIRVGDENPNLRERAQRVLASNADLFVSIHANAADTANGYLRAGGTSTYYKHSHDRDLAAAVQRRLLEETRLPDFGLVGSFNYTPIRLVTWMPAILVEQAFVSNPLEEALMLDPAFRARLARAVRLGMEDHLAALQR